MMDTTVLAAFLEYSPNPTWLVDSDGRCVYANQALREITTLSAAKLRDLNWLELVAEEDRNMSSTLWQEARLHQQRARMHDRAVLRNARIGAVPPVAEPEAREHRQRRKAALGEAPEPGQTVVGLKNHGLTITGPTLDDIFERIEPVIEVQVPMIA